LRVYVTKIMSSCGLTLAKSAFYVPFANSWHPYPKKLHIWGGYAKLVLLH
jgi:hypothetical protein